MRESALDTLSVRHQQILMEAKILDGIKSYIGRQCYKNELWYDFGVILVYCHME